MNEKLLAWLDRIDNLLRRSGEDFVSDDEALGQLRAMLKEPTSEEQKKLLSHFDLTVEMADADGMNLYERIEKMDDKIRAAIMAKKRTVTREQLHNVVINIMYDQNLGKMHIVCLLENFMAELGLEVKP